MIDNRVNILRSWRGMRYIRLVPFASLFLFVVFVHVVYIKLSGDNTVGGVVGKILLRGAHLRA